MAPVDDHGLEAIRKSANQKVPGDKSSYYIDLSIEGEEFPSGTTRNKVRVTSNGELATVRTGNLNDTATNPADVSVAVTSTKLLDLNLDRLYCAISNVSNKTVRLKFQAADVDDLIEGIALEPGDRWEMPLDNIYTGEISAILDGGAGTGDIALVEW